MLKLIAAIGARSGQHDFAILCPNGKVTDLAERKCTKSLPKLASFGLQNGERVIYETS
jgi:hypothetical protein